MILLRNLEYCFKITFDKDCFWKVLRYNCSINISSWLALHQTVIFGGCYQFLILPKYVFGIFLLKTHATPNVFCVVSVQVTLSIMLKTIISC